MINEVLGADGAGQTFRIGYERDEEGRPVLDEAGGLKGGTDYTLTPPNQLAKAGFEKWMTTLARNEVLAEQGSVPPDVFAEMMAKFADRKAAGHYAWQGPMWRAKYPTEDGQAQIFYLLTRQFHADLLPDVIARVVAKHPEDVLLATAEMVAEGNPQALRKLKEGLRRSRPSSIPTPSRKSAAPS